MKNIKTKKFNLNLEENIGIKLFLNDIKKKRFNLYFILTMVALGLISLIDSGCYTNNYFIYYFAILFIAYWIAINFGRFFIKRFTRTVPPDFHYSRVYSFNDNGFVEKLYDGDKTISDYEIDWKVVKKVYHNDNLFLFFLKRGLFTKVFAIPKRAFDSKGLKDFIDFLENKKLLKGGYEKSA